MVIFWVGLDPTTVTKTPASAPNGSAKAGRRRQLTVFLIVVQAFN